MYMYRGGQLVTNFTRCLCGGIKTKNTSERLIPEWYRNTSQRLIPEWYRNTSERLIPEWYRNTSERLIPETHWSSSFQSGIETHRSSSFRSGMETHRSSSFRSGMETHRSGSCHTLQSRLLSEECRDCEMIEACACTPLPLPRPNHTHTVPGSLPWISTLALYIASHAHCTRLTALDKHTGPIYSLSCTLYQAHCPG